MKKKTIAVSFEEERLNALIYHMEKKDVDLQAELSYTIQKLYEKHVPQPTREYIEDRIKRESSTKGKEIKKSNGSQVDGGNSVGGN